MMIIIDRNELTIPADRQSDDELARPEMGSQVSSDQTRNGQSNRMTRPEMGSQMTRPEMGSQRK